MDRLLQHDPETFYDAADRWLVTVDDAELVRALGERAIRDGRRDLAPALLRRWAQPRGKGVEAERVECLLLTALMEAEPIEDWLWDLVVGSPDEAAGSSPPPLSWSAWAVLSRLEETEQLRARVLGASRETSLLIELKAASEVLGELPGNAEGLRWLAALHGDPESWERFEALSPRGRGSDIGLRHLAVLIRESEQGRDLNAVQRVRRLNHGIEEIDLVQRERPAGVALGLGDFGDALSGPDLAVIVSVREAMQERAVVAAWFAQADADLADTGSEYGGVLTWADDGSYVAEGYLPRRRQGDQKFFSPPELIEAMYTGLAHYHFHAQAYYNAEFAGPGRGDLDFTDALGANTLTLTFIDRDRLNVDLALPGRRVIDLGTVRRPEPNGAE